MGRGQKCSRSHATTWSTNTEKFQELQRLCNQIGLWIVPVGEFEGFCKSVGDYGPRWVQQVIEQKNLADDAELEAARKFVQQMWASRSS